MMDAGNEIFLFNQVIGTRLYLQYEIRILNRINGHRDQ